MKRPSNVIIWFVRVLFDYIKGKNKDEQKYYINRTFQIVKGIWMAGTYRIYCFISLLTCILNLLLLVQIIVQNIEFLYILYTLAIGYGFSYLILLVDEDTEERNILLEIKLVSRLKLLYVLDNKELLIYFMLLMILGWVYFIWLRSMNLYLAICLITVVETITVYFVYISRNFWF